MAKLKGLLTKFCALKTAASVKMVKIEADVTCPSFTESFSLVNPLHLFS